jgi:hypothetical protein
MPCLRDSDALVDGYRTPLQNLTTARSDPALRPVSVSGGAAGTRHSFAGWPYHGYMTSAGGDPAGWGRDGVTRYELAEEILALLRTDSGRELRRAESADPVVPADVARFADAHRRYTELREGVHRLGPAEIETIIAEYGPLARAAAGTIAS